MNQATWPEWREGRRRVLVVDDVWPMREALAQLLSAEGYVVETAANAAEVLGLLKQVRWDGVVMDIDRPAMNGVGLYAKMVQVYEPVRLPVVFLSCHPNEMLRFGLESAPWARLVRKPCAFALVAAALRQGFAAGQAPNPAGM